ncbi:LOW QUALITY PROTEIN: lamin tail domain-containing protein 2 [Pipistrellus kuhlii]|uniref:LOW QUALITY PROTEIN: lamin tail domain-containing protein 2 n=1 Tax=Pipistrellus kuhlii TaxID=59472 RepID=UPI001E26F0E5|nr:LOW QUALITY PROTEIN: lamin tail domain-containing protein 2 [Pipistrellus kuhlii]
MAMLQSLSPPGLLGFQASASPRTSKMAPKSFSEAGEAKEEALPSLADGEPVNGHLEPPADTPAGPVAPAPRRDTKPRPTHVASTKLPLAPESLDPPTLRLVWRQRELEIQALRSLQSQRDAQRSRILREVARLPPERESSRSQEKLLHTQVQKLTLELKKQKEQAQLEKQQLEEQLEQTKTVMHQLEEELEGLHKSCLMQLASTSWVGRILKSSTGSVEVVTAETLLDLSDTSDQDEGSSRHEGFRMEDVDWNAIAHRYPNLLASIHSSSESKRTSHRQIPQLPLASPTETPGSGEGKPEKQASRLGKQHSQRKSVEWSSLPVVGDSGGSSSSSSSSETSYTSERRRLRKAPRRPTPGPGHVLAEHIPARTRSSLSSQDHRPRIILPRESQDSSGWRFAGDSWAWSSTWCAQEFRPGSVIRVIEGAPLRSSLRSSIKDSKAGSEGLGGLAGLVLQLGRTPPPLPPSAPRAQPPFLRPTPGAAGQLAAQDLPQKMLHVGSGSKTDPQTPPPLSLSDRIGPVRKARKVSDDWPLTLTRPWSWKGSCLKIVAVNLRERFIRVLNQSTEETVDLGGYTLQQLDHDFPVYLYRFPPHTLLEPRHHVTVCPAPPAPARNRRGPRGRGKGPGGAKQPPSSVGGGPRHFHASGSFVTLLLSPKGELLSQFQAPHSVTPAPRTFEDNTTVSIDRFPLPDAEPAADTPEKGRRPRPPRSHPVPRARGRRRPRWGPWVPGPPPLPRLCPRKRPPRPTRSPTLLPGLTPSKRSSPGEVPATPERAETDAWEPLPALPRERACAGAGGPGGPAGWARPARRPSPLSPAADGPGFADYQAGKEHKEQRIRVSRKTVDRDCPFVALSVQSMREKRFGFRLLSCPPIPVSTSRPV